VQELGKLLISLELLDKICLINNKLIALNKDVKYLPDFVDSEVLKVIKKNNFAYVPSVVNQIRQQVYLKLYNQLYENINLLKKYKEDLFSEIKFIQNRNIS